MDADSGNYLDFEVEIGEGQGREYPLTVLSSPAGEARETLFFPFDEVVLENRLKSLEIALLRSGGSRRQVLSREGQAVQDFGRQLFSALFVGEARTRYDMSADIARRRGLGLRLKLRIQAPELAKLPWEFLYDPRQGEYICMSTKTPIVRYIELPQPIQPLDVQPPLQILGMVSSPSNLPSLDIEREKKRLETAIGDLQSNGLVKLTWLNGSTWRDLQHAMRGGPWHIFHFIGHGGFDSNADEGVIAIEDEDRTAHLLLATEMGRLLADHRSLRLAILNACEGARGSEHDIFSSTAAVLVRRGMPAVLAMQYAITDRAAIEFSRAFYEALADGLPVDASVCEARKSISMAITNTIEWGTPVLYMRTPHGTIFEMPRGQKIKHTPNHFIASETDKELQTKLDQLFTDGLAAFWVEDWDRACARFQSILDVHPDYPEAASRLEESIRYRRLSSLYTRAVDYQKSENWSQAIATLEELIKDSPDYKDASNLLKAAHKQNHLAGLYDEARKLFKANQWQAVVKVLGQISSIDPNYPDVDNLLPAAEKEATALKQKAELEAKYGQAVRAMGGGQWENAQKLFKQIQVEEPGYLETDKLLARVEGEISSLSEKRQRQERINSLYEQAHGLIRAHQWSKALTKLGDIRNIDDQFFDSDGIADQAKAELAREEQETQRQTELSTMYAEAVRLLREEKYQEALEKWGEIHTWDSKFPDRQKVQATAKRKMAEQAKVMPARHLFSKPALTIAARIIVLAAITIAAILTLIRLNPFSQGILSNLFNKEAPVSTKATSFEWLITPVTPNPGFEWLITPSNPITQTLLGSDPTMYDDFNFTGTKLDNNRWDTATNDSAAKVIRQFGALVITTDGYGQYFSLTPRNFNSNAFKSPVFIEAEFMLDPNQNGGTDLTLNFLDKGMTMCQIWGANGSQVIQCWANFFNQYKEIMTKPIQIHQRTWHTGRIEADPTTMTFSYYIDDLKVGEFTPDRAGELKDVHFVPGLGSGCAGPGCIDKSKRTVFGYFDNVRIGAIADDPMLYDNFNNTTYDGRFNTTLWAYQQHDPGGSAIQKNGVLVFSQGGIDQWQKLRAIKYWPLKLMDSVVFEASLEGEMTSDGTVQLQLKGDDIYAACDLHSMSDIVRAHCWSRSPTKFMVPVAHQTWHTVRIEIDLETNVITFFIDGKELTEDHYERPLRGSSIYLSIGVLAGTDRVSDTRPMVGYVDDVRVMPLK
jgi:tetratricopeptide (TPR) repeat protein